MRYVVLDTEEAGEVEDLPGQHGLVLGRFHTEESARALALQRLAYGDRGVVVLDARTGAAVYPPPDEADVEQRPGGSGTRRKVAPGQEQAPRQGRTARQRRSR